MLFSVREDFVEVCSESLSLMLLLFYCDAPAAASNNKVAILPTKTRKSEGNTRMTSIRLSA